MLLQQWKAVAAKAQARVDRQDDPALWTRLGLGSFKAGGDTLRLGCLNGREAFTSLIGRRQFPGRADRLFCPSAQRGCVFALRMKFCIEGTGFVDGVQYVLGLSEVPWVSGQVCACRFYLGQGLFHARHKVVFHEPGVVEGRIALG